MRLLFVTNVFLCDMLVDFLCLMTNQYHFTIIIIIYVIRLELVIIIMIIVIFIVIVISGHR